MLKRLWIEKDLLSLSLLNAITAQVLLDGRESECSCLEAACFSSWWCSKSTKLNLHRVDQDLSCRARLLVVGSVHLLLSLQEFVALQYASLTVPLVVLFGRSHWKLCSVWDGRPELSSAGCRCLAACTQSESILDAKLTWSKFHFRLMRQSHSCTGSPVPKLKSLA